MRSRKETKKMPQNLYSARKSNSTVSEKTATEVAFQTPGALPEKRLLEARPDEPRAHALPRDRDQEEARRDRAR